MASFRLRSCFALRKRRTRHTVGIVRGQKSSCYRRFMERAFTLPATVVDGTSDRSSPLSPSLPLSLTSEFEPRQSTATSPEVRLRSVGRLTNHLVVSELERCNSREQQVEAELLLFRGELDARQLYREHATASTFEFCVARLGYSEDVAWKRVGAARLIRRFPRVYALLQAGRIHLTALMLIKSHLTEDNHERFLAMACNKSKRQVEKLVVAHCPRPDVPASVRKLPEGRSSRLSTSPAPPAVAAAAPAFMLTEALPAATANNRASCAARVAPLSSSNYRVTFPADERLKNKLDQARELLSHCINPADLSALVERAIDALLEGEKNRRFGARRSAKGPGTMQQSEGQQGEQVGYDACGEFSRRCFKERESQHKTCQESSIRCVTPQDPEQVKSKQAETLSHPAPADTIPDIATRPSPSSKRRRPRLAVKRAVFERDGGQCTYVDEAGRRCAQRHLLEFDHIEAHAVGRRETVSNLRLRCKSHNQLAAENLFGRNCVKSAVRRAQCIKAGLVR